MVYVSLRESYGRCIDCFITFFWRTHAFSQAIEEKDNRASGVGPSSKSITTTVRFIDGEEPVTQNLQHPRNLFPSPGRAATDQRGYKTFGGGQHEDRAQRRWHRRWGGHQLPATGSSGGEAVHCGSAARDHEGPWRRTFATPPLSMTSVVMPSFTWLIFSDSKHLCGNSHATYQGQILSLFLGHTYKYTIIRHIAKYASLCPYPTTLWNWTHATHSNAH